MSLYKFFESYALKNKELTMVNIDNPMDYFQLYEYYRINNSRRFPIQILLDKLFEETLINCSKSKREYDHLKEKTLKISQSAQHLFNFEYALHIQKLNVDKCILKDFIQQIEKN